MKPFPFFLAYLLGLLGTVFAEGEVVLSVSFDSYPLGVYTSSQAKKDWPGLNWDSLEDQRARVVKDPEDDRNHVLEILYPAGKIGSRDSGAQLSVDLPLSETYELSYRVRFPKGFEWTRGGKLPGLTSNGTKFTGGKPADGTGWSARYMWRPDARLVVYLYHLDQPDKYGEDVDINGFVVQPGAWFQITQRIQINTKDNADGRLQVWVDDSLLLDRSDVRFRKAPDGKVDHFYFSTFYGGSTKKFAPEKEQRIWVDDFVIRKPATP